MTGQEIVNRAFRYKNFVYWYGAKGQKCTDALLQQLSRLYPNIYTASYIAKCRKDIANYRWAVDCSGLVCLAYGIDQIGTSQMLGPFKVWHYSPLTGMVCWRAGHCGIYYHGAVIEARGVDYDITASRKYDPKDWEKILYMPDVEYTGNMGKIRTVYEYLQAASEVLQGVYGTGEDRKKKLQAAGFNYQRVQNIVNAALKEDK